MAGRGCSPSPPPHDGQGKEVSDSVAKKKGAKKKK
jgi:hypothetical protein